MAKQTFTTGQVLTAAQMTSLQQTAMGGGSTTAKTTSYVLTAADAGTVVAMNAAGATTITVNTGLFSAGDTVFIQNWGAGTCTVTAGTATVTTHGSLALAQWEGGTLYFTSASAAIFFDISQTSGMTNPMTTTGDTIYSSSGSTPARLGIGSTGQVLTVSGGVPSWATPAAGGMTLISTYTANNTTTTASFTSIPSTYKHLLLIAQGIQSAAAFTDAFAMRLNNDTGANYTFWNMGQANGSAYVSGAAGNTSINAGGLIAQTGDTSARFSNLQCWIYDYASSGKYKPIFLTSMGSPAGQQWLNSAAVQWNNTSVIDRVDLYSANTENYKSGTIRLYGVS